MAAGLEPLRKYPTAGNVIASSDYSNEIDMVVKRPQEIEEEMAALAAMATHLIELSERLQEVFNPVMRQREEPKPMADKAMLTPIGRELNRIRGHIEIVSVVLDDMLQRCEL